jgi:hypothetical protein
MAAPRRPAAASAPGRPLTLRAMLAADCSSLPARLRHLIHVLALHADNTTGRGLTGQRRLARYMGVSDRHVRNLLSELEVAWAAGDSPVGVLRESRFLNSDRYTLVIRDDAPQPLTGPRVVRNPSSASYRNPSSAMTGSPRQVDRNPSSASPPNEPEPQFLQSTLFPSTEGTTELKEQSSFPPGGAYAPAGNGEQPAESAARAARLEASQRLAAARRAKLEGKG